MATKKTYKLKGKKPTGFDPYAHSEVVVEGKRYYIYRVLQFKRDAEVVARNLRKAGYNAVVRGSTSYRRWGVYRRHRASLLTGIKPLAEV